jgi:hypothetical protein
MENRLSGESLIKQLMTSSKCEVCGQHHKEEDIVILGHVDEMWVLQVFCSACHSQALLAALIDENEDTEYNPVKELTDLMETEIQRFENTIITANDVLDMQIYLSGFQGTIDKLLEQDRL